jgi:hypothetical protein
MIGQVNCPLPLHGHVYKSCLWDSRSVILPLLSLAVPHLQHTLAELYHFPITPTSPLGARITLT